MKVKGYQERSSYNRIQNQELEHEFKLAVEDVAHLGEDSDEVQTVLEYRERERVPIL